MTHRTTYSQAKVVHSSLPDTPAPGLKPHVEKPKPPTRRERKASYAYGIGLVKDALAVSPPEVAAILAKAVAALAAGAQR
jgi:hypothetical protein